jgi:hypothetical protein
VPSPVLRKLEPFDDMRNGPAHEPEVDGDGTLEPDGLDGGGHHAPPERCPLGREDHVLRALKHLVLSASDDGGEGGRRGDDLEEEVPGRRDALILGTERSDSTSDRLIHGEVAGHESPVGPPAGNRHEHADDARLPHRSHASDPFGLPRGCRQPDRQRGH